MHKIIVILGPTASGKSFCAEEIAKQNKNVELINADAFQIYKDMDVGTAKIKKNDPLRDRYHLLDIVSPADTYSSFNYQKDFREVVSNLLKGNKDIIVVGGTGLYIRAALYDYSFMNLEPIDMSKYQLMDEISLHNELAKLDEEEANKIPYQNKKRVLRAIEIILGSGSKKSDLVNNQNHKPIYENVSFYFLNPNRDDLYLKINERTKEIIDGGLLEETRSLLDRYVLSETSKHAIGYSEAISYINNEISFEEMYNIIAKRTRNYAKRQVTFFKNQFVSKSYSNKEDLIKDVLEELKNG